MAAFVLLAPRAAAFLLIAQPQSASTSLASALGNLLVSGCHLQFIAVNGGVLEMEL